MRFEHGAESFLRRIAIVRQGAEVGEYRATDTPQVAMNRDGEIKMSLRGTFLKNDVADLLTDHIRPYVILDGKEHPLGEFVVTTVKDLYSESGAARTEIEAYDLAYLVKRRTLEERIFLAAGTKYTDAVQALLLESGLEKILCESNDATLATDREDWELGESYLTVVNQLLGEINYNSLWIDLEGNARLSRYHPPDAASIRHTYRNDAFSLLGGETASELDVYQKYNVFRAVVSNPDYDVPLTAVSVNDDPNSPLSVMRLGRIAAPVERLSNIADQAELQTYVDNCKAKSMIATETITFITAILPTHEVGDVVALQNKALDGIYEETEWALPLSYDETMSHKARRVTAL